MPATQDVTDEKEIRQPSRRRPATAAGNDRIFAHNYLQIARLLLAYGRTEVARRRLQRVVEAFGNTPAAAESRNLLTALENVAEIGGDGRRLTLSTESGQS